MPAVHSMLIPKVTKESPYYGYEPQPTSPLSKLVTKNEEFLQEVNATIRERKKIWIWLNVCHIITKTRNNCTYCTSWWKEALIDRKTDIGNMQQNYGCWNSLLEVQVRDTGLLVDSYPWSFRTPTGSYHFLAFRPLPGHFVPSSWSVRTNVSLSLSLCVCANLTLPSIT